jgi:hypothetical protein
MLFEHEHIKHEFTTVDSHKRYEYNLLVNELRVNHMNIHSFSTYCLDLDDRRWPNN